MSDDNTTSPEQVTAPVTTTTPADGGDTTPKGHVPYARFSEKVAESNLWKQQVEDLRKQVAEVDTLRAKVTDIETQFSQARTTWDEERAFTQAGLADEEAADLARYYYNKVPAESRPEGGIGAWLSTLRADPTTAPKALAAYLGGAPVADSQAKPGTPPRAPVPAGTGRPAPASGNVTAEALAAAKDRALKTGDWTEHRTLRNAYAESQRK